jgi:adenylosuccinate lyase
MFAFGEHIGRQAAHDVVFECAMESIRLKRDFLDMLAGDARVQAYLSRDQIAGLLDPTAYTGLAVLFVDRVLERAYKGASSPKV